MRILLTGKNGQVGFELRRSLMVLGEVYSLSSNECDLTNETAIRQVVRLYQPDVIVNPAAYTAVDRAENDSFLAESVNAKAPKILAEEADKLGAILVHFSTDYVFDGQKTGTYTEQDKPNPLNVYGTTKLEGELSVQSFCQHHIILRTSWVLGYHGNNFIKTILRLAAENDTLKVVADQFGAPTSASLLADVTAHLLRQASLNSESFPYGLFHVVADGVTNWYDYACYVVERARASGKPIRIAPDCIYPIPTTAYMGAARRSTNSRLDTTKLCGTFGLRMPHWQEGVNHVLDQILDLRS
jgi:dTDP-4-dehydrorhamnose reductase